MGELTPEQERQLQAAYLAAFAVWLPVAEAAALAGYVRFGAAPAPSNINNSSAVWNAEVARVSQRDLQPVAADAYAMQVAGMSGAAAFSLQLPFMAAVAGATAAFLGAQPGEVVAALRRLVRGTRSVTEAAAAVAAYLDPRNPHWSSKAAEFARTEGNRWEQAASLAGAISAERADGLRRIKTWVAHDDELTRAAHFFADGQERALLQPFSVGGFPMMMPLDPRAPVDLVANCRCRMRIGVARG